MPEVVVFFFKYTATTEIYTYVHTRSLHDALPIFAGQHDRVAALAAIEAAGRSEHGDVGEHLAQRRHVGPEEAQRRLVDDVLGVDPVVAQHAADRKSTRLNSSH